MIVDLPELREKTRIFANRQDAGEKLAKMLAVYKNSDSIVLAVPAGGVPVAAVLAEKLNLGLDTAVVSKVTLPWNTEAGFGAVAFDGTVRLNEQILGHIGLSKAEINERVKLTAAKVRKRLSKLRVEKAPVDMKDRKIILVDDGIASGFTLLVAVEAIKNQHAKEIIIAVPTGHRQALRWLEGEVEAIYCANVRSGFSFAVAEAYQRWYDVDESEAIQILKHFG